MPPLVAARQQLKVPVIAVVENMSYFACSDCGKQHDIYGPSHIDALAKSVETDVTVRLPIDPTLATLADTGKIESYAAAEISELIKKTGM